MQPRIFVLLIAMSSSAIGAPSAVVTKAEFGARWPLKVNQATLECREGGQIVLKANGKTYWFNGLANGAAKRMGWSNLEDIWIDDPDFGIPGAKKNIGPLNDRVQQLCR